MKKLFTLLMAIFCLVVNNTTQAQTSGTVYRDYNGNGTRQTSAPNEPLVRGIIVNAYNSNDALVASYTTTTAGTFSIPLTGSTYNGTPGSNTGSVANAVAVRLEFIIPASGACDLNPNIDYSTGNGSTVGSSVRFITGGTTGITYAVNKPADFISSINPTVFMSKHTNGNPLGGGNSGTSTWFVGFPYNSSGTTAPTLTLNGTTIGSTWGIAYSKQAGKVFTSAFLKRHAGLGVMGSGGIYMLTPTVTSFTVTNFYDLDAVANSGAYRTRADAAAAPPTYGPGTSFSLNGANTIATYLGSVDAASGQPIGMGVIGTNVNRGLPNTNNTANWDPAAFDQVGKVGLGDLEISDDGKYLFVINLYDRKVYRLELNNAYTPTSVIAVTSYALPAIAVTNGVLRPFGAKFYRDKLYVGAVSTAENAGTVANLNAYVFELNNPTGTASFTGTPVVNYPLNYVKGGAMTWTGPYGTQWYPWSNNSSTSVGSGTDRTYPTPVLSNIEFDERGDMIMAFFDRGGHQWSEDNYQNLATSTTLMRYAVGGDILVAGSNCNQTFTVENNGAYISANGTSYNSGAANNQGPGTSEFFKGDTYTTFHSETSLGSLAFLPGSGQVYLGSMDPLAVNTGGTKRLFMSTGLEVAGSPYQLSGASIAGFGKAISLGDIEFLGTEPPVELGNRIWNDTNGDGIQEPGEPGIAAVTLELVDAVGNPVDSDPGTAGVQPTFVTTDATGNWYITSATGTDATGINYGVALLPNTQYKLRLASGATDDWDPTANGGTGGPRAGQQLVGFQLTIANKIGYGHVDLSDNDAAMVSNIPEVTITTGGYGQNNHAIDFGFKPLASLGDKVWRDDDQDGVQDAGEPGVAGITVTLYNGSGTVVGSTTTDAVGNYLFDNLAPGTYTVGYTLPANYTFTQQNTVAGDGAGTATDSDPITTAGATFGRTRTITLVGGQIQLNVDAGIKFNTPPITQTVGDKVWLDNGGGIPANSGNGVQDANEPGVAGVTVTLFDGAAVAIGTTITDANGNYLFTNVPVGSNYRVGFSLPVGMIFTIQSGVVTATGNSDVNITGVNFGKSLPFNVASGDNLTYIDAGILPHATTKASLGDRVWEDTDHDGVQDANEPGIADITVNLLDGSGNPVLLGGLPITAKTDAFGYYMFTNLDPGGYMVEFIKPGTYTFSPRNAPSGTQTTNSDAYLTGRTALIVLVSGDRNTSNDAGMYRTTPAGTLKLGDKVWNDYDKDGIQDANEPGFAGITVKLYQNGADGLPGTADDVLIATTSTDVNGNYLFVNLAASAGATTNYNVQFSNVPSGYSFTAQNAAGSTAANDNDASSNGKTGSINLLADNLTIDAGVSLGNPIGKGSLGNKVWYDLNSNGVQDAGELGAAAVTVTLQKDINGDGLFSGVAETSFATASTNALGEYMFGDLDPAAYRVVFSNMPLAYIIATKDAGAANDETDSDGDNAGVTIIAGTTSTTGVYIIAQGEDNLSVDLGLVQPPNRNTLGDYVWFDQNGDGLQTAGEPVLPGVMITLYNSGGTAIAYTTTDANGQYMFTGLADGTYNVGFSNYPAGFDLTTQSVSNDLTGSDANIVSGITTTVTLNYVAGGTNRDNRSLDAGLISTRAALGNYAWLDTNGDGIQDITEKGIAGVTVTLYASDGTTILASAITDQNGKYLFSNLAAGSYVVGFATIPGGLEFTQQNTPGDNGNNTNSDANSVTGKSSVIVLSAGEADLTIDAGIRPRPTATVGDYVWSDLNSDGIQDANEPGIGGIVATLYNSLNQPIGSAVTDGNGYYLITNVPPGTGYYVIFSNSPNNPSGIQPSFTVQGGPAGTNTSHADATGRTNTFTVNAGDKITNIDAGIKDYPGRAVLAAYRLDVSATLGGHIVNVKWVTENEINTSKFIVERSVDNISYTNVGEKAAAGTYAGISNYNWNDDIISLSAYTVIYYRIKQINANGSFLYSKIVVVRISKTASVKVWPNPFADKITVSLVSAKATAVQVRIIDYAGRTAGLYKYNVSSGNNQLDITNLGKLPKGSYTLQITDESGTIKFTEKLIK